MNILVKGGPAAVVLACASLLISPLAATKNNDKSNLERTIAHIKYSGLSQNVDPSLAEQTPLFGAEEFRNVVILGTNSVEIKNQSVVISGDLVVNEKSTLATVSEETRFDLTVGNFVETSAESELFANSIYLKTHALITSDVYYQEALLNEGTVLGVIHSNLTFPVYSPLPTLMTSVISGNNISLKKSQASSLASGDYGDLTLFNGATLVLEGGDYSFDSINMAKSAQLLFNGAAKVLVRNAVSTNNSSFVGPSEEAQISAKDIIFFIEGADGAADVDNDPIFSTGTKSNIYANVYAPNGIIRLGNQSHATGAFIARDVWVGNSVQVTLDSAFVNDAPQAIDDMTVVNNGGTVNLLLDDANNLTIDSVLANDSDPNADDLSVTEQFNAATLHGTLHFMNADGTFSYTHDGSDTLSDSFTYEVCDNGNPKACRTATVNITVNPRTINVSVSKAGTGDGTVMSIPSGINCGTSCSFDFLFDTTVTLVASANANSTFVGWSGDADCSDGIVQATVAVSCVANFNIIPEEGKEIKVSLAGTGTGVVTSNPLGISCGSNCAATFALSETVTLTAVADVGSTFEGWLGNTDCEDGVIIEAQNTECIAVFNSVVIPDTIIQVSLAGDGSGRVVSSPNGIDCGISCYAEFLGEERIILFAFPDEGSEFVEWQGDPICSDGVIGLGGSYHCTAVFRLLPIPDVTYSLEVVVVGSGAVSSNPAGILCTGDCQEDYQENIEVRLFARPDPDFNFSGWTGDPDCVDGIITMDADKVCIANFTQ